MTNAAVLPVPVSAHAIRSLPPSASGITALWTGRVETNPRSRIPSCSRASSASDAYGTGVASAGYGSSAIGAAAGVFSVCGCAWGWPPRRGPLRGRLRPPWPWLRSVVLEFKPVFWLAGAEGNDPADRIVRRHADGHAVSWNHLDAKAAHAAAELRQDFVAGIALHAVKPAAVHRHDGALHVD